MHTDATSPDFVRAQRLGSRGSRALEAKWLRRQGISYELGRLAVLGIIVCEGARWWWMLGATLCLALLVIVAKRKAESIASDRRNSATVRVSDSPGETSP